MKACPKCAEEVQDAAKVCRYCGHKFLEAGTVYATSAIIALAAVFIFIQFTGSPETAPQPTPPSDPQNSPSRMKRLVSARLRDPNSAIFTIYRNGCGMVNSRNGFGGMTGDQGFIVYPDNRVWLQEQRNKGFSAEWNKRCT